MKNKTKTYMLLVAVLGIWGTIGYKIINGLNSDEPLVTSQEFNSVFKPNSISEVEKFSIQDVERDPFLGSIKSSKKRVPNSKKASAKSNNNKQSKRISFGGLVKKQNSSDQVFVVNINSNQYLLKKGQIADSVKLISGNTKEIVIRYNNNLQTIPRQ